MAAPTLPTRNAASVDAASVAAGPGASVESHPWATTMLAPAAATAAALLRQPCGVSLCGCDSLVPVRC